MTQVAEALQDQFQKQHPTVAPTAEQIAARLTESRIKHEAWMRDEKRAKQTIFEQALFRFITNPRDYQAAGLVNALSLCAHVARTAPLEGDEDERFNQREDSDFAASLIEAVSEACDLSFGSGSSTAVRRAKRDALIEAIKAVPL